MHVSSQIRISSECYSMYVYVLPAMSLKDWFRVNRKVGQGGLVHPKAKTAWLCLDLAMKILQ